MAGKDKQTYKKESYIKKLKEAKEVYEERKNFLKEFALKKPKSDSGERESGGSVSYFVELDFQQKNGILKEIPFFCRF